MYNTVITNKVLASGKRLSIMMRSSVNRAGEFAGADWVLHLVHLPHVLVRTLNQDVVEIKRWWLINNET